MQRKVETERPSGLVVENLTSGYDGRAAVRGVSFCVPEGHILLVIGPNGAGKSTLLKAIAGLQPARSDALFACGRNLDSLPAFERFRSGLSFVQQGGPVFGSLTVAENLELAASNAIDDPPGTQARLLKDFDFLPLRTSTRAGLLSGGQRQCLALAMAVARRSRTLLLDEPTAGVSPSLAEKIFSLVSRLSRQSGVTVVLAEHRVHDALGIADQAILLHQGILRAQTADPAGWKAGSAWSWAFLPRGTATL